MKHGLIILGWFFFVWASSGTGTERQIGAFKDEKACAAVQKSCPYPTSPCFEQDESRGGCITLNGGGDSLLYAK